jgi:hypothetical protein
LREANEQVQRVVEVVQALRDAGYSFVRLDEAAKVLG